MKFVLKIKVNAGERERIMYVYTHRDQEESVKYSFAGLLITLMQRDKDKQLNGKKEKREQPARIWVYYATAIISCTLILSPSLYILEQTSKVYNIHNAGGGGNNGI